MAKPKTDYKTLKSKWYKKLKKSGFKDIEANNGRLNRDTPSYFKQYGNKITWQAKHTYYYIANQFLHNYKFSSNLERIIWEYHSNGISMRDIAKLLNKTKIVKTNKDSVCLIVRRLSKIMKSSYLVRE